MISSSSMRYLQRQRIFLPPYHAAKYYPGGSKVHTRPVAHLPEEFPADTPARRVLTQLESQRVPYKSVPGKDQDCEGCTAPNA